MEISHQLIFGRMNRKAWDTREKILAQKIEMSHICGPQHKTGL